MTRERLEALHGLVAAVREWSMLPTVLGALVSAANAARVVEIAPVEQRLMQALAAVEACGGDVAVVVALNTPQAPAGEDARP